MSWKQVIAENGEVETFDHNATDGDLYIAYALMEATKGLAQKADDYNAQAKGHPSRYSCSQLSQN